MSPSPPPGLARRLLYALLPSLDRDVVIADLDEEFSHSIAPRRSRAGANLWYWRQVMTSLPGAARLRARFPWSDFVRDMSHGVRLLRRNPTFAIAAVATLTLGIGATSAVFTVANAMLLRPLPYAEPDRLVAVMEFDRSREAVSGNVSWPDFLDYQAQNQTLTGLAGYTGGGRTLNRPGLPPERVRGVMVTGNFFDVLGVPAALGRTFQPADMPAGAPPVVILSHAAWRTRFASDPAIVGRAIDLNGRPTTVIGVLPEDFQFTLRVDVLELPEVDSRHVATMEVTLWSLKELTNHRQEPGRSVAPREPATSAPMPLSRARARRRLRRVSTPVCRASRRSSARTCRRGR